ncbi:hypothetical protein [Actinoalloteichus hymeniacidonis]|uniref:hypothetical protein n=1 Tax=Actinoalloteichus hymeniacidonis TaxID=340345 RepID=UPI0012F7622E|nr:hypothetical protein [Actinoalloteichus hymeniacidonis]MBB5908204.1 putative membrane protein YeiB [Actinoalloteichus hymeniacidonis]
MSVPLRTWLSTIVMAYLLDRAGIRGPAEQALRKLTYRAKRREEKETAASA